MSRGTAPSNDRESLLAYRTAWRATKRLLRQGRSFSGHEPNCAFLNCRGSRFANVSAVTGLDFADDGRALGVTDWDQDGDLDVWLASRTGPRLRLMRNQTIRSDTPADASGRFVELRMRGTTSNRDAIGARVTIRPAGSTSDQPTLIQTLRAGDAYLSQSSKWLHFGLGESTAIDELTVRWPSGLVESFPAVPLGGRYELVEGSGEARPAGQVERKIALTPSVQQTIEPTQISRTYFSNRVPIPLLNYRQLDADEEKLIEVTDQPLLVTFWASWCRPCLVELAEFTRQAEELKATGIRILALTVDGLDASQSTSPADARADLERLKFPFESGWATPELLDKLSVVEELVFNYQPGMAVPTSFLFDAGGDLAVVYKGPVELNQLREDLTQLGKPLIERRQLAVPMSGRWVRPPRQLLMRAVGHQFHQRGYEADHARFLKLDAEAMQQRLARALSPEEREKLTSQFAATNFNLGLALMSAGEASEAAEYFRRTLQLKPDHLEALINLGGLLGRARQPQLAIRYLQRAVELEPDSVRALTNLAAAQGASGQFSQAVPHYQTILNSEPNNAQAHAQLGRAFVELSQHEPAAAHLRRAVELNPRHVAATMALTWLQSTSPVESVRDGAHAVQLASQLRKASGGKNPMLLDMLAAAYAEQGDFASAKSTLEDALARLGTSNPAMREALTSRLAEFKAGRAYRDADGKYP